jgi:hypothetical protein
MKMKKNIKRQRDEAWISLRMLPNLKKKLIKLARKENRTISSQAVYLIKKGLEKEEFKDEN